MNVEFNVVFKEQNEAESFVVFEINEISLLVRKTSIGQLVESRPFELNYPMTIGKSKWVVILFLNGQYDGNGKPNDRITVYLKMIHCEHQSAVFNFDVKFQLGDQHTKTFSKKDQSISFGNVRTRWIWIELMDINEMIKNVSRYIQDDTLMLSVHLNEHFTERVLVETFPTSSYNNNNLVEKESYAKAETDIKPANLFANSSPQRQHSSNQSNITEVCNAYSYNLPHTSYNASDTAKTQNNRKRIFDNNLNYVNNEYSDDEDVAQNSTNSTAATPSWMHSLSNYMRKFFEEPKPK